MTDGARRAPSGPHIIEGDCLEILPSVGPVDVAITDPPYNVGKDYGEHDDAQSEEDYLAWLRSVFVAIETDSIVFFPGKVNLFHTPALLPDGFRAVRVLGWHRKEYAGDLWTSGPAMSWEPIVWASRLEKPFYNRVFGAWGRDFLVVNSVKEDPYRKLHPCPKPFPVMRWLVGLFCPPGGTVLDPFMGTGTTLVAARDLGARGIGIELNPDYCRIATDRLNSRRPKDPSQEVLAV